MYSRVSKPQFAATSGPRDPDMPVTHCCLQLQSLPQALHRESRSSCCPGRPLESMVNQPLSFPKPDRSVGTKHPTWSLVLHPDRIRASHVASTTHHASCSTPTSSTLGQPTPTQGQEVLECSPPLSIPGGRGAGGRGRSPQQALLGA